ncbi:MAG TPA: hypothetical protein VD866_10340 [Urbifossiella sp.]|nr:hypothetical protein [Urbifossiella sp.]
MRDCVVIANGSVNLGRVHRSIVIADGELTLRGPVYESIVVGRADIRVFAASRSSVVAGGRLINIHPNAQIREALERVPNHTYRGETADAFGLVRFTTVADLGVDTVSEFTGGVRVTASLPGGLLPHRAFHAGDEIVRVGETPVASAFEFRRLVRDSAAVGREIVVLARRAGRPFAVRVGPASSRPG